MWVCEKFSKNKFPTRKFRKLQLHARTSQCVCVCECVYLKITSWGIDLTRFENGKKVSKWKSLGIDSNFVINFVINPMEISGRKRPPLGKECSPNGKWWRIMSLRAIQGRWLSAIIIINISERSIEKLVIGNQFFHFSSTNCCCSWKNFPRSFPHETNWTLHHLTFVLMEKDQSKHSRHENFWKISVFLRFQIQIHRRWLMITMQSFSNLSQI